MAYKFQLGDALMNGTLKTQGDLEALRSGGNGGALACDDITLTDGQCSIQGDINATGNIMITDTAATGKIAVGDGVDIFSIESAGGSGNRILLGGKNTSGGGTNYTSKVNVDINNQYGRLQMGRASGAALLEFNYAAGRIVCAKADASQAGVNSTIEGSLTVDDDMTVLGNFTAAASAQIELGSKIIGFGHKETNETNSHFSSVEFGNAGTLAHGANIHYATGSTAHSGVRHLAFCGGAAAANGDTPVNGLPVRCGFMIGSGAGLTLTSVPSGLIASMAVIAKAHTNELAIDKLNYIAACDNKHVFLPALSTVAVGDQLAIKMADDGVTQVLQVRLHADDNASGYIDSLQGTITLNSKFASVKLVKASVSKWVLM